MSRYLRTETLPHTELLDRNFNTLRSCHWEKEVATALQGLEDMESVTGTLRRAIQELKRNQVCLLEHPTLSFICNLSTQVLPALCMLINNSDLHSITTGRIGILKSTMLKHGFRLFETEWWHYSWPNENNKYEVMDFSFKQLEKLGRNY